MSKQQQMGTKSITLLVDPWAVWRFPPTPLLIQVLTQAYRYHYFNAILHIYSGIIVYGAAHLLPLCVCLCTLFRADEGRDADDEREDRGGRDEDGGRG